MMAARMSTDLSSLQWCHTSLHGCWKLTQVTLVTPRRAGLGYAVDGKRCTSRLQGLRLGRPCTGLWESGKNVLVHTSVGIFVDGCEGICAQTLWSRRDERRTKWTKTENEDLSSTQKVLVLGQRVLHGQRGYGNVCMVDHTLEKCYHVHYDHGEQHSYNRVQANSKFTLVETATQADLQEKFCLTSNMPMSPGHEGPAETPDTQLKAVANLDTWKLEQQAEVEAQSLERSEEVV